MFSRRYDEGKKTHTQSEKREKSREKKNGGVKQQKQWNDNEYTASHKCYSRLFFLFVFLLFHSTVLFFLPLFSPHLLFSLLLGNIKSKKESACGEVASSRVQRQPWQPHLKQVDAMHVTHTSIQYARRRRQTIKMENRKTIERKWNKESEQKIKSLPVNYQRAWFECVVSVAITTTPCTPNTTKRFGCNCIG